tara:strand:- start:334 stop:1467 length:1134 start_codon:yes stop_codon:yes gene_type:complete
MKFIDINKQYKRIKDKVNQDLLNNLERGDFILGKNVDKLESRLSKYVGVKNCITCASGTDALQISLMAYNIGPGDAVFTTNFSYFATTEVISLVGATPVFIDIDENTFNISSTLLEEQILKALDNSKLNPKAIIAVDLFGQLSDYESIQKISKKYNLILIEDAAQSFGASFNNKKSGSFGDIAATSFFPAKPLGCYGDGGAIFTDNQKIAELCKSIRVHGQGKDKYDNIRVGLNSRLDTIQATILLNKLDIFDNELLQRNNIAKSYKDKLNNYLVTPYINSGHISSWAQYSLLAKDSDERENLISYLNKSGIPTAIYYKKLFSDLEIYKDIVHQNYEVSKSISGKIFSIPMHPYLDNTDILKITDVIRSFFNENELK